MRTTEQRAAISAGQAARHAQQRQALPPLTEGYKTCNRCGKRKYFNIVDTFISDFSTRKRNLADGTTSTYPDSRCRKCRAEETAARRAALPPGELGKMNKQWREARRNNAEKVEREREYQRNYQRRLRREQGTPPRKFTTKRKYPPDTAEYQLVDAAPLAAFLRQMTRTTERNGSGKAAHTAMGAHQLISVKELGDAAGVSDKTLGAIRRGEQKTIELSVVDRLLTYFDCVHLSALWYPPDTE